MVVNRNKILIIMILVIAAMISILFFSKINQKPINHMNKNKTLSGVTIPAIWQARARKLGYYCPSWNTNHSGIISSSICLKVGK